MIECITWIKYLSTIFLDNITKWNKMGFMMLAAISDHVWSIIITTIGVIAVAFINREVRHTKRIAQETHKVILLLAKQLAKQAKDKK